MIPNPEILKALLAEPPVQSVEALNERFYAPCLAELQSSKLFECVLLDDPFCGDYFFSYFIFPRDDRSLRLREGYDKGYYRGVGLVLYLCIWHPIAAYGAISASTGPSSAGYDWLLPAAVQSLPSLDWNDVDVALTDVLRRYSIAVMTREEAMMPLTALGLLPPAESNITDDTDHVFFAFFNNDY